MSEPPLDPARFAAISFSVSRIVPPLVVHAFEEHSDLWTRERIAQQSATKASTNYATQILHGLHLVRVSNEVCLFLEALLHPVLHFL
jgi:hypothetical protein